MNRRTFLKSVPALAVLASSLPEGAEAATSSKRQMQPATYTGEVIKLNKPDLKKGIPTMTALQKRRTERNLSDKRLTLQQLSELLWSADGINRPEKNRANRTSPAAMAKYAVDIYVVLPEGVYFYDVAKHELKPVAKGDFRKESGMQDFVYIAAVNLVYVLNLKEWKDFRRPIPKDKQARWIDIELGSITQNVHLYCASENLGAVIRGMIDENKFSKVIKVKPEEILLAQTVGNIK